MSHQHIGNHGLRSLIWSDFTLYSSSKVKGCLNGFVEFSSWWIQFASVLRYDRSSFTRILIQVIYCVEAAILNWPFKPLNFKILNNMCTHVCTFRCVVWSCMS